MNFRSLQKTRLQKKNGFTLIELLVVISIIALLVSILMPALGRAKEQAKFVVCKSNLHNYGLAMNMYLGDNEDAYPYSHNSIFRPYPNANTCSWHDGSQKYTADKSLQGPLFTYLDTMDVHLCPTFETFAMSGAAENHKGHDITPVYSYSQNNFLGANPANGRAVGVTKASQVKNPSEVLNFVEETLWPIYNYPDNGDTFATHILNDTCFMTRHPADPFGQIGDCIATYHNTSLQAKNDGQGNGVFCDGHVDLTNPLEWVTTSWGRVSISFKKVWPKGTISARCPY